MRMKVYGNTFAYRSNEQNPYEQVCEALEALEALAEQHEMTNIERHERNVQKFLAEQPAQQEPFGFAVMENPIAPPVQRTWVGLTDEEMRDLEKQFNAERVRTSDEEYLVIYPGDYWAWQRAIEAKLREKNSIKENT